jgi:hypothetical protein
MQSVLAQDYPAGQRAGVPDLAYEAPGATPYVPEPTAAAPGQARQAAPGATTPAAPGTAAPAAPGSTTPSPAATNANNLFPQAGQGEQFAMAAESFAPNMIGDWLAPTFVTVVHQFEADAVSSPSGGFGRFKMADDTSPLPQDRVFTDSSYFGGALSADATGGYPGTTRLGIYGFEAGFEKTFLSGGASVEVRGPFCDVQTVGSNFCDLGIAVKGLLVNRCDLAICAGMSMNVPTAPNVVNSKLEGGSETVVIENQSVHLLPFVGALWMPSCRFFMQGYVQVDADASGNEVMAGFTGFPPLKSVGRLYDQTFLYVDVGAGYWLRRGDCSRLISGVACMGEIHVNQSCGSGGLISDGTIPSAPALPVNDSFVDFTAGVHLDVGQNGNMTIGYVAPLTGGPDRLFNNEFRAFYNYRF